MHPENELSCASAGSFFFSNFGTSCLTTTNSPYPKLLADIPSRKDERTIIPLPPYPLKHQNHGFYPWSLAGGGGKEGVTRGRSQIAPAAHFQCVALCLTGCEAFQEGADGLSLSDPHVPLSATLNHRNKRSPSITVRKQPASPKQTSSCGHPH